MSLKFDSIDKASSVLNFCMCGAIAASFSLAFNCHGQEKQVTTVKTHQVLQEAITQREVAGAVSIVADPSKIIDTNVVGFADIEKKLDMKADSIFWIASMSKPVTGACVMMLVDDAKIALDDPIKKYLPDMAGLKTADGKEYPVTIRQLLNHTSGMREIAAPNTYSAKTLEEAAVEYSKLSLMFEPGTKWQYSQTSINTAARIVEVVSGMRFEKFVENRICKFLGMKDTAFYLSEEQNGRVVTPYKRTEDGQLEAAKVYLLGDKKVTDHDRMPAANGGLFSTASDYTKFCQMLLNKGTFQGTKILSAASVEAMRTISTGDLVTGFTPGNGWGVGCCVVREPQGATESLSQGSFGHGGAFGTQAWIDPNKNRIYILMVQRSNFANGDASNIRRAFQEAASKIDVAQ